MGNSRYGYEVNPSSNSDAELGVALVPGHLGGSHDKDLARQDWINQFGNYLHRRRTEIMRMLMDKKIYGAALEVGCGDGIVSKLGISNVIGIDVSPRKAVTVLASAECLPFQSDSFDLVFAGEVLEHLTRPGKALVDWSRVLKSGGTMIVSTPNGILVRPRTNPEHERTYAPTDVTKCLTRIGLRVTYVRGIFTGLVSGRRVYRLIFSDKLKMILLRLPVPLRLSYDVFFEAVKNETQTETLGTRAYDF